jgi:NADH-quinone oxidoreductase subunit L
MFLTFFGDYRGHEHPHESPPVMWVPLAILAVLSLAGGLLFKIPDFLHSFFPVAEVPEDQSLMMISVAAGVIGIFVAWVLYVAKPAMADSLAGAFRGLYTTLLNKYYVDEIYDATVVTPLVGVSRWVLWKGTDAGLIDGAVNGVGWLARSAGGVLRQLQSGNIRSYATWILFGSVVAIVAMFIAGTLPLGVVQ